MIDHGHSHAEILRYTWAQFNGYMEAAAARERDRIKWQAITARAAQYQSKDWKAFIKGLEA